MTRSPDSQTPEATQFASILAQPQHSRSPSEFLAAGKSGLDCTGLYSWWVDDDGAAQLSAGLGVALDPGLIYAGQAGANSRIAQRPSASTLWRRIGRKHLGRRVGSSTFRRSLGSILTVVRDSGVIDEATLTKWMVAHLRVIAIAVPEPAALDRLETAVLGALDPPLNITKMPRTELRSRLRALRSDFRRGGFEGSSSSTAQSGDQLP